MPRATETKRATCSECKRLKLKCDRQVPCNTCVKRGYTHLCPNGANVTGEGHRLLRAGAVELREKMAMLSSRIHALEGALRTSHAQDSTSTHPLLREDLLAVARLSNRDNSALLSREPSSPSSRASLEREDGSSSSSGEEVETLLDSLGSFAITDKGNSRYFGHGAGPWRFLTNECLDDHLVSHRQSLHQQFDLPILATFGVCSLALQAPPHIEGKDRLYELRQYLPSLTELARLEDLYYAYSATLNDAGLSRKSFAALRDAAYTMDDTIDQEPIDYHRLAVIFALCACATVLDPDLNYGNPQAEYFSQLARAAFFSGHAAEYPTIDGIQALLLMVIYLHYLEPKNTKSAAWTMLGTAIRMAQTMGLHQDAKCWDLPDDEVDRRRYLYWTLFGYDSWQALQYGLPPSIHRSRVNVQFPFPDDPPAADTYVAWRIRFARDVLGDLHARIFSAAKPSYACILEADARIRTHPLPPALQIRSPFDEESTSVNHADSDVAAFTQRQMANMLREYIILVLHRSHFDLATSSFRDAPLKSPYGTSVVAAYRAAWAYIAAMQTLYNRASHLVSRTWHASAGLFTAGVVLGSIITRCPDLPFATQSFIQLAIAYDLMRKIAPLFGERVQGSLDTIAGLFYTCEQYLINRYPQILQTGFSDADVLSTLGGRTRRIICPIHGKPLLLVEPTPSAMRIVMPFLNDGDIQPTINHYLRRWDGEEQDVENFIEDTFDMTKALAGGDAATWEEVLRSSGQPDMVWDQNLDRTVEWDVEALNAGMAVASGEQANPWVWDDTWGSL